MCRRIMAEIIKAFKRDVFYNVGIAYRSPRAARWSDYLAYDDGRKIG